MERERADFMAYYTTKEVTCKVTVLEYSAAVAGREGCALFCEARLSEATSPKGAKWDFTFKVSFHEGDWITTLRQA